MSVIRQVYCTIIICCLSMNTEFMFAWPSSTLNLFSSTNTTLNRPMTETEKSLFGSLSSIASLMSTPLTGVFLDLLGRKYCCIIFAIPPVVAWTLVSLIPRVEAVLVSIFLSGLSGCIFMIAPNFISEISQDNIRGTLTACNLIFSSIGLLLSYILGACLDYYTMNYVCLTISVATLALLSLVKESPVYLMKKGLEKEAENSICFYRSIKPNSNQLLKEMEAIRRIVNPQLLDVKPEEEALKPGKQNSAKLSKFQFIKKSKSTLRGLGIILTLYLLTTFQGLVAIQVYSKPIFEEGFPNISADLICISFAVINIIAGLVSAYLLDYLGRRPVLIYSTFGTCVICLLLGTQIQFHWSSSWMTVVFLFAYCIMVSSGSINVPGVMVSELFLPEVRGIMTMLAIEWLWCCNFLILFIINPFASAFGLGSVFYVFSCISLICSIFSLFYLPETKGLSIDVIQTVLLKGKQF